MAWVESISPSFRARHHMRDADAAERVLYGLEHTRARLARVFPRTPEEITVVLHEGALGLAFTNPLLPLQWAVATPASRRYIAGWANARELHVLSPAALDKRASNVEGSREMLALAPAALYARRVIVESSPRLSSTTPPRRLARELRYAWLLEGGARWFAGQTAHARPAIARRLREGPPPQFPPRIGDAALLGQTVIDMLARAKGDQAAARFVCRLEPLTDAFGARSRNQLERAWHAHLARIAQGQRERRLDLLAA